MNEVSQKTKAPLADTLRRADRAIRNANVQQESSSGEEIGSGLEFQEDRQEGDSGALKAESPSNAINATLEPDTVVSVEQAKSAAKPVRPKPKMPPAFKLRMPQREEAVRKRLPIRAIALVLAAVFLIGIAILGYLKWRQHLENEKIAQLKALDQGSLESMKTKATIQEKLGTSRR